MAALTTREANIVLAAIHLQGVNDDLEGYVPDYALLDESLGLSVDDMREIRDIIQA